MDYLEVATYTFTIWSSDSDFCQGFIDECTPAELTLTIDNSNSEPFINLISPYEGERVSVSTETVFEGVARNNDGTVSRVDFEIKDVLNNYLLVSSGSISDIEQNGAWSLVWDSTVLIHDRQYLVRFRSYDGYDYSDWAEVTIVADNLRMRVTLNQLSTQPVGRMRLFCTVKRIPNLRIGVPKPKSTCYNSSTTLM